MFLNCVTVIISLYESSLIYMKLTHSLKRDNYVLNERFII